MASKSEDHPPITTPTRSANRTFTDRLRNPLTQAWTVAVYTSTYLALIAVIEVLIVSHLLELPSSPAPLVVGLITFAIYVNDRLVDLDSDSVSKPRRTAFIRKHATTLYVFGALAYGTAVALSIYGGPLALALTLLPGVVWLLYALDWIPSFAASIRRLKDILIVNTLLVAGAWALTVVFLPIVYTGAAITPTSWLLFGYFAVGAFISVEIANVSDIEADSLRGVATLPVVVGIKRTRQFLVALVILLAAVLIVGSIVELLSWPITLLLGAGLVWLLLSIGLVRETADIDGITISAECARLPVFLLLVAVEGGLLL